MFKQKGFIKITTIIIVLILLGGFYFIFSNKKKNILLKNNENQSNQSLVGNSSIDNWKTYIHEKTDDYSFLKKFSIKYPPNAKIETGDEEPYPYILISFQENDTDCSMISPPKIMGDEGYNGEVVSKKIIIGSRVWEENIWKNPDGVIDFYGLSSDEVPINFDLTPNVEERENKCLSMYKKILSTIEFFQ